MLKLNVARWDRWVRILLAVGLSGLGIATRGWISIASFAVAAVLLVTAACGFCPMYATLRRGTLPRKT